MQLCVQNENGMGSTFNRHGAAQVFRAHPSPANVAHLTMRMYKYAHLTNTPTQCIHRHSRTDFCLVKNKTFPPQMKMGLDVHYSGLTIILTFTSLQTELSIHNMLCSVVEAQLKLSRNLTFSFYSKCAIVLLVMLILIQLPNQSG